MSTLYLHGFHLRRCRCSTIKKSYKSTDSESRFIGLNCAAYYCTSQSECSSLWTVFVNLWGSCRGWSRACKHTAAVRPELDFGILWEFVPRSSLQATEKSGITDGKAFSTSTLGGDMPFWRVDTDLFPRGRVDLREAAKDGVCQRQLSWTFLFRGHAPARRLWSMRARVVYFNCDEVIYAPEQIALSACFRVWRAQIWAGLTPLHALVLLSYGRIEAIISLLECHVNVAFLVAGRHKE